MTPVLRKLWIAALAFLLGATAQAQIAYRAGSSVSVVSTDVMYVGTGGEATAASGNVTAPLPANWQVNDLWLAVIESRDNVQATMPAGWTLLNEAGGAGGLHRATLFWKRAAAGDAAPLVTHPGGGRIVATIAGFRRVDLDQPFDVLNSFTGSPADLTTEAASITTESRSMLVFTGHIGAFATANGALSGSSPWVAGAFGKTGGSGDGVSVELHYSDMREPGAQAALTLTHAESGESHGALLALKPDGKLIVPRPAGVAANDLMVASIAMHGGLGVAPTVSPPAGWVLVRRSATAGGALEVYRKTATASEPASYTWVAEAKGGAALGMQVFSGVDVANPIDVEDGQNTASGLAHATPSVSTTVANTMLVTSHAYLSSDSWTPPAGMTETIDVSTYPGPLAWGLSLEMNYAPQAAAGATGAKTATVANNADNGHTHILALRPGAATQKLHFVHPDHLNTPRLVADSTGTTVWRWDQQEPFGNNPADENPSGLGNFDLPLRLPGQYFDKETNLSYNYFRDYDPSLGRYVESDPVGLRAGINTYAYVHSSSLILVDIRGNQSRLPFVDTLKELLIEFFLEETAKNVPQPGTYGGMIGKLICDNTKGQVTSSYQTCMAGVGNTEGCSLFQVAGVEAIQKCIDGCRNAIKKCNPICPP